MDSILIRYLWRGRDNFRFSLKFDDLGRYIIASCVVLIAKPKSGIGESKCFDSIIMGACV